MSAPSNLTDCYTHELKDLISANDQMKKVVEELHEAATNEDLKSHLKKTIDKIDEHTSTLKELLEDCGESGKEHCKGMEGLCKEAKKHAIEEAPHLNAVQDVVILSQYQRLCHYGICGFGTSRAFAEALGKKEHANKLEEITGEVYYADEEMTKVAESCVNEAAKA